MLTGLSIFAILENPVIVIAFLVLVVIIEKRAKGVGAIILKRLMELISLLVVLGVVLVSVLFTNFSGNPVYWRLFDEPSGWHVLSEVGILVLIVVTAIFSKSIFKGAMTGWFALGVHEVLYYGFYYTIGLKSTTTPVLTVDYLTVIVAIIPVWYYLWGRNWIIFIEPTVIFNLAWYKNPPNTLFGLGVWEIVGWSVTIVSVGIGALLMYRSQHVNDNHTDSNSKKDNNAKPPSSGES